MNKDRIDRDELHSIMENLEMANDLNHSLTLVDTSNFIQDMACAVGNNLTDLDVKEQEELCNTLVRLSANIHKRMISSREIIIIKPAHLHITRRIPEDDEEEGALPTP
jgi:hypothetical protein